MPKCIFLVGIPCSGKTTWRKKNSGGRIVLCRDNIRTQINNGRYVFDTEIENRVSSIFNNLLKVESYCKVDMIIDNTNLKWKYVNEIKKMLPKYEFEYIYFPISLWKANLRNIIRWMKTGKYIPFKVMKRMYNDYKNLKKYE